MWQTLTDFYRTKEWCKLLVTLKLERVNERGELICEYCGKPIVKAYDCIGHHKIELTEENFRDANISLNPDNIMLIHHKCHNIIHNKLQHSRRSIYIVYGSPLAGKRKYVNDVANEGDLIVDIDRVWSCVSGGVSKSGRLNAVVFGVRDYLLDCIKYRRGKWLNAYVIGGYPLISERERLAKELGAELIYIDSTKEECIKKLYDSNLDVKEYTEFIETWWSKYSPPSLN